MPSASLALAHISKNSHSLILAVFSVQAMQTTKSNVDRTGFCRFKMQMEFRGLLTTSDPISLFCFILQYGKQHFAADSTATVIPFAFFNKWSGSRDTSLAILRQGHVVLWLKSFSCICVTF